MHTAICDFISDCLQNSVEANSSYIKLLYDKKGNTITTTIEDNGKGMTQEQIEKARDPFYTDGTKHVNRKVGLGIPFLLQALDLSGGSFDIWSGEGAGTKLKFSFDTSNIDTPPEGDISSAVLQAMMFDKDYELEFIMNGMDKGQYIIKRSELFDIPGDITADSITLARRCFRSREENLDKGGC